MWKWLAGFSMLWYWAVVVQMVSWQHRIFSDRAIRLFIDSHEVWKSLIDVWAIHVSPAFWTDLSPSSSCFSEKNHGARSFSGGATCFYFQGGWVSWETSGESSNIIKLWRQPWLSRFNHCGVTKHMGVSIVMGDPSGWFRMEHPIKSGW